MIKTLLLACAYACAVHYAYLGYIYPTFEYAHYTYLEPSWPALLSTYALSVLATLACRENERPAQAAAGLIYVLCYVPAQLILLFTVERTYDALLPAQLALAFSMCAIFVAARTGPRPSGTLPVSLTRLDWALGTITLTVILIIVATNREHMRFVSFEDVYDLRADANAAPQNVLLGYLSSWLSYSFISYFFARGLVTKRLPHAVLGFLGCVVLYMTTGAKASLLLLPMTAGVLMLWQQGKGFVHRTMLGVIATILGLTLLLPNDGASMWVKSIVLVRVIGTAGWTVSKYLEYFSAHEYTYYTHIGPVGALFGGYPYGDYSLGQTIGIEYSGNPEANFNASFWASDGFAALGIAGIFVATAAMTALLYAINVFTAIFPSRFTVAWLTGFLVAMLNVPLTTALLSGGGAIILLIAWIISLGSRMPKPAVERKSLPTPT
jgi:hypothetical protein